MPRSLAVRSLLILILAAASLAPAQTPKLIAGENLRDLTIGIDRSGLSAKDHATRARVLAGIRGLGATWFRDGYSAQTPHGLDDFIDEVRLAKQEHLNFLEIVLPVPSDFDETGVLENAGAEFAKHCGWPQGSRRLSSIDLDKFAARLRSQFDALKVQHLEIDAFEIGNEFDSYCFNGDVPNGRTPTQQDFLFAVRAYARFLSTSAEIIHSPQYFPDAKIITFGIAHGSDVWDKPPHHFSDPARMIAQLRNLDGVNYLDTPEYRVDGFGFHIYPSADNVAQHTLTKLQQDVAGFGRDRPIWITEWGLDVNKYPNNKGQSRAQGIAEFYRTLKQFSAAPLGPVFYYSYDGPAGGSVLADPGGALLPDAEDVTKDN
jgi:hypothetical protein